MPGFVNIKRVFSNEQQRTLPELEKIYANKAQLMAYITEVAGSILNETTLAGKRVLLKPNWVRHGRKAHDEICLCTHNSFVLAFLELVLQQKPSAIVLGDAPVQGCNWDKMITASFLTSVAELSQRYRVAVMVKDFRRVTFNAEENVMKEARKPLDEYIIFDLGKKSYLEPVSSSKNNFRVTLYDPDRFRESHTAGVHKYCITRELFQADVVISIPKVKTHQKAGITAALKNIVGLNGDKDFLPHHRIGGTGMGGDCYPGSNRLRYWAELCLDHSNRNKGKRSYWFWLRLSSFLWKLSFPKNVHQIAAGWYGNDTTWRMVLDLNLIVNYGKADGTLATTPQRSFYSLSDGIIGGQGNGPLDPDPLNLGMIAFTNDSAWHDLAMGVLMGMNVDLVPLLAAAKDFMPGRECAIQYNGKKTELHQLRTDAVHAVMPPGWYDYMKAKK